MTIKSKLSIWVIAFLLFTAAMAAGSFFIFDKLDKSFDTLKISLEAHTVNESLKASIAGFIMDVERWAHTADPLYRNQSREKLADIRKSFDLIKAPSLYDRAGMDELRIKFNELNSVAGKVLAADKPVGNISVNNLMRGLEDREQELLAKMDSLHAHSIQAVITSAQTGDEIKSRMAFYFAVLLILSSLAFTFFAFFMRRMFELPFKYILTATDRITSGDLDYRIDSKRDDEFGVIAKRFDQMVGELQSISEKNKELYISAREQLNKLDAIHEVAKAIPSTLDLDELLKKIAESATRLLNAKGCIIRLIEGDKLTIRASFGLPKEIESKMTVLIGEGLPGKVAKDGQPIIVDDLSKMPSDWQIPHLNAISVINVPLIAANNIIGTIGTYDKISPEGVALTFSPDDLITMEGFASLSAIAIEKARMYELQMQKEQEAIEAKNRLDVLFDSVQGGIISLSRDYTVISANKYIERWAEMQVSDIVGKNSTEVFHDRKAICPHCVAQLTLETGRVNAITQKHGSSYAALTSYPLKDGDGRVTECVVFVQDITDASLYHEEILSLYKEVARNKEYLDSFIENSADAIVTTTLEGVVTSWNKAAERIYGFTEAEALDNFLPFLSEDLKNTEREHIEKVRNGEVLKDIEAARQRKDGSLIEVSLTLSPIKDAAGNIIGISGISRDISGKKQVEKELIRKNNELSRLSFISSAMRSTLDLERLMRMTLTAVTMGDGLGFNRACLFLLDETHNVLKGVIGAGPASYEEAGKIWERLASEKLTLTDVMHEIQTGQVLSKDSFFDRLSHGLEVPLDNHCIFARAVREKRPFNVTDARNDPESNILLIQQLGTEAYAVVPLISRDNVIGLLWVDNLFNREPITEEDMRFLVGFSNQVASAIESAKLFEKVSFAEAELENIFKSISDMLYFTNPENTIMSINNAVAERLGLPEHEIVGRKCFNIFHGMKAAPHTCPHQKMLGTKEPTVEELEIPHLGATFIISTSPIFDQAHNFLGTVHILRDITEVKLIREKLVNAERMAALGEVAARVAHEIRNPLVSVGGFAQRLERKLDGNLKEYATIITSEVKRLEDILRDILGFVRQVRLSRAEVDMNALLRDVLSLVDSEVVERGVSVETTFGDVPKLYIDPDRIKEALLNIFKNAIQAVVAHGKIIVRTYTWGADVVIEIIDTGTGISEKDLPFIFDPFYTTKPSGTGLGLAITHRIIEEHNGRIKLESELGKGTTITILLPVLKEEA